VVPAERTASDATDPAEKQLLLAKKMNSTAVCLLRLSLTDKIRQTDLYNRRTEMLMTQMLGDIGPNLFTPIISTR
jgi:hypothetical protein